MFCYQRDNFFEEHYREERLFELIARGSPEDLNEIEEIIRKDRRTYLYDLGDANSVVNSPNRVGHTPLYIASQNGNLKTIKYLIGKQANPMTKSKVSESEEESNLSVAARWKHAKVVQFYLESYSWPYADLKKAKHAAGNVTVRGIIAQHMAKLKPKGCGCFCHPAKHR